MEKAGQSRPVLVYRPCRKSVSKNDCCVVCARPEQGGCFWVELPAKIRTLQVLHPARSLAAHLDGAEPIQVTHQLLNVQREVNSIPRLSMREWNSSTRRVGSALPVRPSAIRTVVQRLNPLQGSSSIMLNHATAPASRRAAPSYGFRLKASRGIPGRWVAR